MTSSTNVGFDHSGYLVLFKKGKILKVLPFFALNLHQLLRESTSLNRIPRRYAIIDGVMTRVHRWIDQ